MGMNVYEAPAQDTAYTNSPQQLEAARIIVDQFLAADKPDMRDKVLAMIFGNN